MWILWDVYHSYHGIYCSFFGELWIFSNGMNELFVMKLSSLRTTHSFAMVINFHMHYELIDSSIKFIFLITCLILSKALINIFLN